MRDFAKTFYKSQAWKNCRDRYARQVGGLCERCLEKGMIVSGEIVHHKIHLNPANISDESVTLNPDNLELLCRKCHGEVHGKQKSTRYEVDECGRVTILGR